MGEFALIDEIRRRCALARGDVVLGIGDDAALLAPRPGCELAVSMDTLVSGVHFPLQTEAFDVGWKALAVNLSDLAAMGAEPAWVTLALTLPAADRDWVTNFCDGFAALAKEHNVALVGGDTTQGPLSITVTVHGFVPAGTALRRDGARAGDRVLVSGFPGDAAAGLTCLLGSAPLRAPAEDARAALLQRLNRPTPRVALGLALRGLATAAIDVSDGLGQDLGHIAARSALGAVIQADRLPQSAALAAVDDAAQRLHWQLLGGDDYELCFTAPDSALPAIHAAAAACGVPVCEIGTMQTSAGVTVVDEHGAEINVHRGGWEHFA